MDRDEGEDVVQSGANKGLAIKQSSAVLQSLIPAEPSVEAGGGAWRAALEKVVPCCVVLKVTQNRAVDTESASTSYATGFVVDRVRGIILTNRHVVTPGPITAEAIFLNREETPVLPVYYDPVHDFGFLRFDPRALEFMVCGEIELAPEVARVGLEVRVVGNDSGEKVSILAGTLARLDRDAPRYGSKGYNDFNTFYLQAASGTKGGSSGSPVIDMRGRAVGLNAGGKNKAASAYYLPLHAVVRALRIIQEAAAPATAAGPWRAPVIPRGDLQTTFVFKGFDEVRRLGVTREAEAAVRKESNVDSSDVLNSGSGGMLVVDSVIPGGPAQGFLEPGDVLLRVEGRVVTHFRALEELLDMSVGQGVALEYQRGGESRTTVLQVTDLHSVTPASFLEVAGGTVHALSYQQARNNSVAVGQVYVAEAGYLLHRAAVPKHSIITALAGRPTPDLAAFRAVLLSLGQGQRVPLEYFTFAERARIKQGILHVDWQWYGPAKTWTRNDSSGVWDCTLEPLPLPVEAPAPLLKSVASSNTLAAAGDMQVDGANGSTCMAALEERLRRSMVWVDVDIPVVALVDGVHSRCFAGSGVIVHHGPRLGLVLLDRNTLAVGPGDVQLSFGAFPCEIPGRAVFLHPLHNFSLVAYDPARLPAQAQELVCACEVLVEPPLQRGDSVQLVGLTRGLRVLRRQSTVTSATSSVSIHNAEVPRFRAVHEEVVKLDHDFGVAVSGVLTDAAGRVRALWGSYSEQLDREDREWAAGMHSYLFAPWLERMRQMEAAPDCCMAPPPVVTLDAELEPLPLSKAAQYGLPGEWVNRLVKYDAERRQVLRVRSRVAGSAASAVLREGDMVLAVMDGLPVSSFRDVESRLAVLEDKLPASPVAGAKRSVADASGDDATSAAKKLRGDGGDAQPPPPAAAGGKQASGASPPVVPPIPLTILRDGAVQEVSVAPGMEDGLGTRRLVHWCGAQLQAPHRAVREQGFLPQAGHGVYVSRWHHGSPAHRYGIYGMHFILDINGQPTPDLDAFVGVIQTLKAGEYVRVRVCHLESTKVKMLAVKPDPHYWPTWQLVLDPTTARWRREAL